MKYDDAIAYMEGLQVFKKVGKQCGSPELLKKLGDPQKELKLIHIDGIQGRETIPAYIAMVLKCAGYKVGRYIAGDVFEYREHFQIGGRSMSMKRFCELTEQVKDVCDQMTENGDPCPDVTAVKAAMAFMYFKQQECDLVILTEGDIVSDPEKMIRVSPEMELSDIPKKIKHGLEKQRFNYKEYKNLEIALAGADQVQNAALAMEMLEILGKQGFEISEKALRKGLLETTCPGRFSVIGKKPYFVADSVRSAEAAARLVQSIELYFAHKRILFVMGMTGDAETEKIINLTHKYADWIITVAAPGDRCAVSSFVLASEVAKVHSNVTAADSPEEAAEISHLLAGKEDVIIAFGPVSLIGKLMEIAKNRKFC